MTQKCRLLLCFLTALTSVSVSNAESCQRPRDAKRFTIEQLKGVWSNIMVVDYGQLNFDYTCDRLEYTFNTLTTGLATNTWEARSDGLFKMTLHNVAVYGNELIRLRPFNSSTVHIYLYIILMDSDEFVASVCHYDDGVFQQYTAVYTRSQTTTEAHARDLLDVAGVSYKKSYFFNNNAGCYVLNRSCPC